MSDSTEPEGLQSGDPLPVEAECRYCGADITFVFTHQGQIPFNPDPEPSGTHAFDPSGRFDLRYVKVGQRNEYAGKLYASHKCRERDQMVSKRGEVAWLRRCVADPAFLDEDVPQEWKDAVAEVIETVRAIRSRREGADGVRDGG